MSHVILFFRHVQLPVDCVNPMPSSSSLYVIRFLERAACIKIVYRPRIVCSNDIRGHSSLLIKTGVKQWTITGVDPRGRWSGSQRPRSHTLTVYIVTATYGIAYHHLRPSPIRYQCTASTLTWLSIDLGTLPLGRDRIQLFRKTFGSRFPWIIKDIIIFNKNFLLPIQKNYLTNQFSKSN